MDLTSETVAKRRRSSSPLGVQFNRRKFVTGGLIAGAGLLARPGTAIGATDAGSWVTYRAQGSDGASVSYLDQWFLDPGDALDSALLYPHQSFALRTSEIVPPTDPEDGLPDLKGYPADAAIIWLMYYDDLVEGGPPTELSIQSLAVAGRGGGFELYVTAFSNSVRTFLLQLWLGLQTNQPTVNNIDVCLKSITVPD